MAFNLIFEGHEEVYYKDVQNGGIYCAFEPVPVF